jgi:hypothetical protein
MVLRGMEIYTCRYIGSQHGACLNGHTTTCGTGAAARMHPIRAAGLSQLQLKLGSTYPEHCTYHLAAASVIATWSACPTPTPTQRASMQVRTRRPQMHPPTDHISGV